MVRLIFALFVLSNDDAFNLMMRFILKLYYLSFYPPIPIISK